ncbi:MAG: radical SAM protein, partial [bacterium]|nr:radical SAM protein [bacterium]
METSTLLEARNEIALSSIHRQYTSSLPSAPHHVHSIDLDLTEDCCLRCTYCYKGDKLPKQMNLDIALRAIDWFIEASLDFKDELSVSFMGGEPLLRFDLIKELVPYGKRRARQFGKRMHFGCTTNMVLVNEEIIEFWKKWGMGFHTSIDGISEVQDTHRCFPNGQGSSAIIEKNVPLILNYRPSVAARATFCPDTVQHLYESALYFEKLGYRNIVFSPATNMEWNEEHFSILEDQLEKLSDFYLEKFRTGIEFSIHPLDNALRAIATPFRRKPHCGAGRGLVLIDTEGNIWPCHRWNGYDTDKQWILGSIWGGFDDELRQAFLDFNCHYDVNADCEHCLAVNMCGAGCVAENWQC